MLSAALLGLAAVHGVSAWGDLGHETVAYIAQNYVSSATQSWAQNILDDTSDSYLANIATWADSYRYTDEGRYSAPYHFIDANDDPPSSCNVDYERDCGSTGCSVAAISNYTNQLLSPDSVSSTEVNYALRFVVHFLGDITQPLHDEAVEYGANDVDVTFDKKSTNLHHSWDTNMPEWLLYGGSESDAQSWANTLINEIDNGDYSSQASSWVENLDVNDPIDSAMGWATDANAYVCSTVMPNGYEALEDTELYPDYYNDVIGTIELQIAKGGYRLAKWLDAIVAANGGDTKRSVERFAIPNFDISGANLLPRNTNKTRAQLVREARGYGCNHAH